MNRNQASVALPAAVAAALILAGCGGNGAENTSPDGAEPATLRMGTLWCCDEYIPAPSSRSCSR